MFPREYLPTWRQDDSSTKGVFRYILLYHKGQNISHDSHIKLERNIWYTIIVYYIKPFGFSYEDCNLISWSPEENSAHLADIATHLKGMQVFKVLGEVLKRQSSLDQRGKECAIWVGMYVNKFVTYSWCSSLLRWYLEWPGVKRRSVLESVPDTPSRVFRGTSCRGTQSHCVARTL